MEKIFYNKAHIKSKTGFEYNIILNIDGEYIDRRCNHWNSKIIITLPIFNHDVFIKCINTLRNILKEQFNNSWITRYYINANYQSDVCYNDYICRNNEPYNEDVIIINIESFKRCPMYSVLFDIFNELIVKLDLY